MRAFFWGFNRSNEHLWEHSLLAMTIQLSTSILNANQVIVGSPHGPS